MPETVQLPPFRRDIALRAESYDEATRTIDIVFTTGATVRRRSWLDGEWDEELIVSGNSVRLDRLNAGAPFLDTHLSWDLGSVLGSIVTGSARIDGGQGLAQVKLSRAEDVASAVQKIIDGDVRNVSVGYRIHAVEKHEREGRIPLHRVTDWEPLEVSAVPMGADPGSQIRSREPVELAPCVVTTVRAGAVPVSLSPNVLRRMRMRGRVAGVGAWTAP